ncbi:hypothetical protein [Gelidibacter salicanalis]|nr:hypothetical protein [Gelidibacter salicanalis]
MKKAVKTAGRGFRLLMSIIPKFKINEVNHTFSNHCQVNSYGKIGYREIVGGKHLQWHNL